MHIRRKVSFGLVFQKRYSAIHKHDARTISFALVQKLSFRRHRQQFKWQRLITFRRKALPANIEAERSILGAILLDNLSYNQAAEHLKPEDFLLDSHRRIYSRMVDLAESSRSIDLITLAEELDRKGEFETIGGCGLHFRAARRRSRPAEH